jgi:hypothetical protein
VWPPQNGHTRFLILRGYINQDGERGTEWTVGIETRLDPIPPPELEKLSRVVTGLGTNWMATFQDKPLPPSDSARVELPSNAP